MMKYLRVWAIQIKNNFVREAVYRSNFVAALISDIVWMLVELSLFSVIYANTEQFAGWTKEQTFFFLGIFFGSDALFTTFFQTNFWRFTDLIHKGELDILITKPISPAFLALTRWMSLTNLFNFIFGLIILARYAEPAGFAGGWLWVCVPLWLLFGMFVSLLLRFFTMVWVFWTERGWPLHRLYFGFFKFAGIPDTAFPKVLRYFLKTVLPFAFIGSVPARALLHGLSLDEYALVFGVFTFFFLVDRHLWIKGLKRYQSASS